MAPGAFDKVKLLVRVEQSSADASASLRVAFARLATLPRKLQCFAYLQAVAYLSLQVGIEPEPQGVLGELDNLCPSLSYKQARGTLRYCLCSADTAVAAHHGLCRLYGPRHNA